MLITTQFIDNSNFSTEAMGIHVIASPPMMAHFLLLGEVTSPVSTYANILKNHIQGMPTNIILQVFI